jgi:hypothetical protein
MSSIAKKCFLLSHWFAFLHVCLGLPIRTTARLKKWLFSLIIKLHNHEGWDGTWIQNLSLVVVK